MEDPNMLAADCIVISCCCQCMILQILVFLLLKLPSKLFKKTREYAKKLKARSKKPRIVKLETQKFQEKSLRIEIDDFDLVESVSYGAKLMEEIERELEEFSSRGEFAFGSFWGRGVCKSRKSFGSCFKEEEVDYDDVGYRLMELFGDVKVLL
ncbi:hypothetical protein STAS_20703 [Striga asiatica]|uniref:Uncharacterized protein n=1 Tax=Striga asiatica TaxID=4170 RepID=A0A5A7QFX2_STRAF|nr:hypothetical protein STAS_20703 [Striga asiatica]